MFLLWPLAVSVLRLSLFPFFIRTETPKFIYQSVKDQAAMIEGVKKAFSHVYVAEDLDRAASQAVAAFEKQMAGGSVTYTNLASKKYRKRLFSGFVVAFGNQITGLLFMIIYSTALFDTVKEGYGKTITLVVGLSNFGGVFLTIYLIGKMGRKFNLITGLFFQAVAMLVLLIGYLVSSLWVMIVGVVLFMAAFSVGVGGTLTAYVGEILPPKGVGLALGVQWLFSGIIGFALPLIYGKTGIVPLIAFFGGASLVMMFVVDYFTIETKDKTEDEVVSEFEGKSKYRFMNILDKRRSAQNEVHPLKGEGNGGAGVIKPIEIPESFKKEDDGAENIETERKKVNDNES